MTLNFVQALLNFYNIAYDNQRHRALAYLPTHVTQDDSARFYLQMVAHGIDRAVVCDVLKQFDHQRQENPFTADQIDGLFSICKEFNAVLLIPRIDPLFESSNGDYTLFTSRLVRSKVPFFACDRPLLNHDSLIQEIRRTRPIDAEAAEALDFNPNVNSILPSSKSRNMRSRNVRLGMLAAKARGVKLGNPLIHEARAKAMDAIRASKPSPETLALMAHWRQEGKRFRQIAHMLNERGIKPPRAEKWCGSTVRNQLLALSLPSSSL